MSDLDEKEFIYLHNDKDKSFFLYKMLIEIVFKSIFLSAYLKKDFLLF